MSTAPIRETWEWGSTAADYASLRRITPNVVATNIPQIGDYVAMISTMGAGVVGYNIARASALTIQPGGTNGYGDNVIFQADAGTTTSGVAYEGNANNNSAASGDSLTAWNPIGTTRWIGVFQALSGGSALMNYAFAAGAPVGAPQQYGRGYATFGNSIKYADAQFSSSAERGLRIDGGQIYGIDTTAANSMDDVLLMQNDQALSWFNTAGTKCQTLKFNTSNILEVGYNTSGVSLGATCLPAVTNTFDLGSGVRLFGTIYAATGTINTSDSELKTEKFALSDELTDAEVIYLVEAIPPTAYRWIVGGSDPVETTVAKQRQVMTRVVTPRVETKLIDGLWTDVETEVVTFDPVFERRPVVDANGAQVMVQPVDLKNPASTPVTPYPKFIDVPVMENYEAVEVKYVERPGRRRHLGFVAQAVKAAFDHIGRDYAAWVSYTDAEGVQRQGLRPDQLLPLLWRYAQIKAAALATLEQRVAALEAATERFGRASA